MNCGSGSFTWTITSGSLPPGLSGCNGAATCAITGTPTTAAGSPFSFTIQASDGGTNKATQMYSLTVTAAASACDVNNDNATNVLDVQLSVNQALGVAACTADINQDGACNVIDVQRVINAALGGACVSP